MARKINNILVPVNGGKAGDEAFHVACDLSKANKAQVRVLCVIEVGQELPLDAEVDTALEEGILSRIESLAKEAKCSVQAEYLQARHAGPAIVQEALARGIGLIVMGIPYKHRLGSFTLGTTASHVFKHASCPVILARERHEETTT